MKIGYVITRLVRGGAARIALDTARAVSEAGHEVVFAAGTEDTGTNSLWSELESSGLSSRRLRWLRRSPGSWDLAALVELTDFLNRVDPDCLHLHTSKAGTVGALAARLAGVRPVVYSSHGHLFNPSLDLQGVAADDFSGAVYYGLRKLTIDLVDRVVALSKCDLNEQIELGLGRPDDFTVIPNGIDYEAFRSVPGSSVSRLKEDLSLEGYDPLLVTVGRLVREKNQETLIRAVRELEDREFAVGCLMVGEGPHRGNLESLADCLDVADRVVFTGARDDVEVVLQAGDVFCFPSLYESQGIAVMEAMAAGLPVVATSAGGLAELVRDGETALAVDRRSPGQLASAVERLMNSSKLRNRIVEAARRRIREEFSLKVTARRTLALYEELHGESQ